MKLKKTVEQETRPSIEKEVCLDLYIICIFQYFNSLPNNKIVDQPHLIDFADDKINVTWIGFAHGKSRKQSRKSIKCRLPAFSPFCTLFSKSLFVRVVKNRDCVVFSFSYTVFKKPLCQGR